jgi:hypothetical protein
MVSDLGNCFSAKEPVAIDDRLGIERDFRRPADSVPTATTM